MLLIHKYSTPFLTGPLFHFTAFHLTSLHFTSPTVNTLHGTPRFNRLHCTTLSRSTWFDVCSTVIAMYFYSKPNYMHHISYLFYFGSALYMFRTVFPTIIRSLRLYAQRQAYVIQVQPANCLLAGARWNPSRSR